VVLAPFEELTILLVIAAAIGLILAIYEIVHYGRRKKLE
jgi:hypothetical protein